MHIGIYNFALGAKIKSQYLLLRPRILHEIITHNILPKKGHFGVTFMDTFLIDYMISDIPINLPYIMIRIMIITHGQKKNLFPIVKF